jgi:hypothetical protein
MQPRGVSGYDDRSDPDADSYGSYGEDGSYGNYEHAGVYGSYDDSDSNGSSYGGVGLYGSYGEAGVYGSYSARARAPAAAGAPEDRMGGSAARGPSVDDDLDDDAAADGDANADGSPWYGGEPEIAPIEGMAASGPAAPGIDKVWTEDSAAPGVAPAGPVESPLGFTDEKDAPDAAAPHVASDSGALQQKGLHGDLAQGC